MPPIASLLLACAGPEPTDPVQAHTAETHSDSDADTSATGDTGEIEIPLSGPLASIVLGHWPADAHYPDGYYAYGVFMDQDGGVQNLAYCLFLGTQCVDGYAPVGQSVQPGPDLLAFQPDVVWYDAGPSVEAANVVMAQNDNYGTLFYADVPTSLEGPGHLAFGGELLSFVGDDVFEVAKPLELLAPESPPDPRAHPGRVPRSVVGARLRRGVPRAPGQGVDPRRFRRDRRRSRSTTSASRLPSTAP